MKREYDARTCNENDFGAKKRLSQALICRIYHVTHINFFLLINYKPRVAGSILNFNVT